MQCKFDADLLQEYIDATINPLEKLVLEEHLKDCRTCRKNLTELKLLFWELEDADQIDVPLEASHIHQRVASILDKDLETSRFVAKDFLNLQKKILDTSCKFTQFIPGFKSVTTQLEKSTKKAPSLLYKTLGTLVKSTRRLSVLRGRP